MIFTGFAKTCQLAIQVVLLIIVTSLMTACGSSAFKVQNLAKGDIDFVADGHYRETQNLLKELIIKLYRRNPSELKKKAQMSIELRSQALFSRNGPLIFAELDFQRGTDALDLALDQNFQGDRVLALMAGLNGMIRHAFEYRAESFMFDQLDEQKLYQSARNIEVLMWRLKGTEQNGGNGRPLILTNSLPGETSNLSFERLFGKLIALQDMMAVIVSQQNNRLINKVTQNMASMVFFPL